MLICDCVSESKELKSGFSVRFGEGENDWVTDDVDVVAGLPPEEIQDVSSIIRWMMTRVLMDDPYIQHRI